MIICNDNGFNEFCDISINKKKKPDFRELFNVNVVEQIGTICGVNIKPVYKSVTESGKTLVKWGFYLHVKLDNGDQYDLIFDMFPGGETYMDHDMNRISYGTIRYVNKDHIKKIYRPDEDGKCKVQKGIRKVKVVETPTILQIFRVCGVNEWVDLFGKKVTIATVSSDIVPNDLRPIITYISTKDQNVVTRGTDQYNLVPKWYEAHIADEKIMEYVEHIARYNGNELSLRKFISGR